MSAGDWIRVSPDRRCPVCGRHDWCLVASRGPDAICARVESSRPINECGWLHRGAGAPGVAPPPDSRPPRARAPKPNLTALQDAFRAALRPEHLHRLAADLDVSARSLDRLRNGYASRRRAWSFPMVRPDGRIVGIRLRHPDGSKSAITGSAQGLFVPTGLRDVERLLVAEGETDVAALLDLGFPVIGRPSARAGAAQVIDFARLHRARELVIVADADEPGQRGAEASASVARAYGLGARIVVPPMKDARDWKRAGARAADVEAAISISPLMPPARDRAS